MIGLLRSQWAANSPPITLMCRVDLWDRVSELWGSPRLHLRVCLCGLGRRKAYASVWSVEWRAAGVVQCDFCMWSSSAGPHGALSRHASARAPTPRQHAANGRRARADTAVPVGTHAVTQCTVAVREELKPDLYTVARGVHCAGCSAACSAVPVARAAAPPTAQRRGRARSQMSLALPL